MTNYSIDSSIRRKIIVILFVISLLLIKPANALLAAVYTLIINVWPITTDFFDLLSEIGVSVSAVSLLSIFQYCIGDFVSFCGK